MRERTFEDKSGLIPTDSVRREEGLKTGIDRRKGTGEVALSFAELTWTKALVLKFNP